MSEGFISFTPGEIGAYYRARLPRVRQTRAANWSTPCPIHDGKNPNFSINGATGQWRCHSKCDRGGDILDLEMALTGADFVGAKLAVFDIIGRPVEVRERLTLEQWREQKNARAAEERDRRDAGHFAMAAKLMAEEALAAIDCFSEERAIHTKLIEDLRCDEYAVYCDWLERTPQIAEALRRAGYRSQQRQETWLWRFIHQMAKEEAEAQFNQVHGEET